MVTSRLIVNGKSFADGLKEEFKTLDVDKMLAELRLEREQIEEAILTLERLARGRGRRRGRPPGWLKDATGELDTDSVGGEGGDHPAEPKRRGRPPKARTMLQAASEG